jgi:hypothetical protein
VAAAGFVGVLAGVAATRYLCGPRDACSCSCAVSGNGGNGGRDLAARANCAIVTTSQAAPAQGHYSQAIVNGNECFVSVSSLNNTQTEGGACPC